VVVFLQKHFPPNPSPDVCLVAFYFMKCQRSDIASFLSHVTLLPHHNMSFFRRSSRRPEVVRPSSVQSIVKDEVSGFVMRFQEEDQEHRLQKQPSKLIRKKTSRLMDLRPTTATTSPVNTQPEPSTPEFIYDVTIIGAGPAGLALAYASNDVAFV
jgi:hypothetical protein